MSRKEPINVEVLNSIGSPNTWTPEKETAWLMELRKLSAGEIYQLFPPLRKPPNVRKCSRRVGW